MAFIGAFIAAAVESIIADFIFAETVGTFISNVFGFATLENLAVAAEFVGASEETLEGISAVATAVEQFNTSEGVIVSGVRIAVTDTAAQAKEVIETAGKVYTYGKAGYKGYQAAKESLTQEEEEN